MAIKKVAKKRGTVVKRSKKPIKAIKTAKTGKKPATKALASKKQENKRIISKKQTKAISKPKKKELTEKQKEKIKKEVFEKAEEFKKQCLKKYKDMVKTIFVFGSYLRKDFTEESDLDVLILLDDTKMRITDEFKESVADNLFKTAKKLDSRLHIQPPWTITEFWDMVRVSHPLLMTVLRDGWALYDQGFFIPMKKLLERGKIPASLESIELLMISAPKKIERAKNVRLYQVSEDCYYAMLNSSQAVLMYLGKQVPDPKATPKAVKEYLVDTKMLPRQYYKLLEKVIKFRKDVEHKKVKEVTGAKVDEFLEKAEDYVKEMRKIYQSLQNQKKRVLIDKNYEILLKSTIMALKKVDKLPQDPKNLPGAIKKELIEKNYLPKSYLEVFDKVIGMKKVAEKEINKIPERDVEVTRSYVKKFVDILDRFIRDIDNRQRK
ncbi:MAG: nucleotidyltransferase domain-containing protein [Candidatus Aenigmarchaeota archaeon]|nr:nucleotidyltransferase domain-containing protein [Candidatus Aenigmarchaeota archaeon]